MTKRSPTGRLSASEPNIQNIPVRTPEGATMRSAFLANTWRRPPFEPMPVPSAPHIVLGNVHFLAVPLSVAGSEGYNVRFLGETVAFIVIDLLRDEATLTRNSDGHKWHLQIAGPTDAYKRGVAIHWVAMGVEQGLDSTWWGA